MKKSIIILIFLLNSISIFPQSETWNSIGFEHGSLFHYSKSANEENQIYYGSPGFNYNFYEFTNLSNFGMFAHQSLLFKNIINVINGDRNYNHIMDTCAAIGMGFRNFLTPDFIIKYAIGISYILTQSNYMSNQDGRMLNNRTVEHSLGFAGDIGLKYDIKDAFFITIGTIIGFYFAKHMSVTSAISGYYNHESYWMEKYSMIRVSPYINFGINFYRENTITGKPKR